MWLITISEKFDGHALVLGQVKWNKLGYLFDIGLAWLVWYLVETHDLTLIVYVSHLPRLSEFG